MIRQLQRYRKRLVSCIIIGTVITTLLCLGSSNFLPSTLESTIKRPFDFLHTPELKRYVYITPKHDGVVMPSKPPPFNFVLPNASTFNLCILLHGGLGNQMFQFASLYGLAAKKGLSVMIDNNNSLTKVFKINVNMKSHYNSICQKLPTRDEKLDCGYDESMDAFLPSTDYRVEDYLQSWKYFYNSSKAIRNQFVFHDTIIESRDEIIKSVLKKHNFTSRSEVTFIGVHVRRGDFMHANYNRFGYVAASENYFRKAIRYFRSKRLKNTLFIICSNDVSWTKKHMVKGIRSEFVEGHSAGIDMSLLGSCDHMITSVGTFGWWSAWLTGGNVTFYQWPARDGSSLREQFSKDYTDFFYPGWVGFS